MAAGKGLSCSELKKLQISRRKRNILTALTSETFKPLNIQINSAKENENASDNFENPFAKNYVDDSKSDSYFENSFQISTKSQNLDDNLDYDESKFLKPRVFVAAETSISTPKAGPKPLVIEKSLKKSIIIEIDKCPKKLKTYLSDPAASVKSMNNPSEMCIINYYRYPESSLPTNQKKNIHKALQANATAVKKNEDNLLWYRMFSEKWRKALLSAFETLKHGYISMFYFIQENMTVLFEKKGDSLVRAYLQLTSPALAEDFQNNGIEFKIISRSQSEQNMYKSPEPNVRETEEKVESDEDVDEILLMQEIQVKKSKVIFKKEDIMVEGVLAVAELIDFLINQKDRNSYAILPEIYSPGPFVHGTLRVNSISFSGPCKGVDSDCIYQVKILGIIFPPALFEIVSDLGKEEHQVSLVIERESATDFLASYAIDK